MGYAIYKCHQDHTWNKKLTDFKSRPDMENIPHTLEKVGNCIEVINLQETIEKGYDKIEIQVICFETKIRVDKLLSNNIDDLTRSKIERAIRMGVITLNGHKTECKTTIKSEASIDIDLKNISNI